MKVLDLFSGIGGFSLGLQRAGMQTVAFCEIDKYCQKVLRKHWPDVPIYDDVRQLKGEQIGTVDLICGGFPCQPFSIAGKKQGAADDRHLWPEYFRLVQELRPAWVFGENVPGLINMGLDATLADLESEGYSTRTYVIPACAINAPHRRDRVWIVAHTNQQHRRGESQQPYNKSGETIWNESGGGGKNVAYTNSAGREEQRGGIANETKYKTSKCGSWWEIEPDVGRVANGIPSRVDRLRALGNAVVPQIPEIIGNFIMAVSK